MEKSERQRRSYSTSELAFGILAIVLWVGLGALVCALFVPLTALLFFALAAFLIFYEMGKKGCVTCYYCKTCTIGMGKLPDFFFKENGTANVNRRAQRFFPIVYLLLSLLPIVLVAVSIAGAVSVYKVVLLAGIITFSTYTGIVRRRILLGRGITETENKRGT